MRTTNRASPSTGFVALGLALVLQQIISIQQVVSLGGDKVLSEYQPVAMDEALFVKKDTAGHSAIRDYPVNAESPYGFSDDAKISHRIPEPIEETPLFSDQDYQTKREPLMSDIVEMDDRRRLYRDNDLEYGALMPVPEVPTAGLTRLITNRGKEAPTFTMNQIQMPTTGRAGRKDEKGNEILASYNLMIPIFVPAVRSRAFLSTSRPQPLKFVNETVTEMVPVTKTVSHVKEVLKAEKVPQRVITDYVTTRSRTVPPRINDAVLPGERIVTSTVRLID